MTEKGETEKRNSIFGIFLLISIGCSPSYIFFIFSVLLILSNEYFSAVLMLSFSIGSFFIIFLNLIKKEKSHLFVPIGIITILIGIILYSLEFLLRNDLESRISGMVFLIIASIFLVVVIIFFYLGKNQQKSNEGSKTCKNCGGSGKMLKFFNCPGCDGTGIDKTKLDERPMMCYYCRNRGTCNKCKGTKLQRKYLLFGTRIKCKKCDGSGICPICKDAPNGGYYLVFWIDDRKGALCRQELWDADAKIKELTKVWEKLRIQNNEILRFEDFVRLPSYNEQEKIPKTEGSVPLYDLILAELIRYEQYLKKFI